MLWSLIMALVSLSPSTTVLVPHPSTHPAYMTTTAPTGDTADAVEIVSGVDVEPYANQIGGLLGTAAARPVASGVPVAGTDLTLAVQRAGAVGAGTWVYDDGTDTVGLQPPWQITGFMSAAISTAGAYRDPSSAVLADGTVLVVYEDWAGEGVAVQQVDPDTLEATAPVTVRTFGQALSTALRPMPSVWVDQTGTQEVVYCLSWTPVDATTLRAVLDYSTDGGISWLVVGDTTLTLDVTSDTYDKARVFRDPCSQQLVMLIRKHTTAPVHTVETYVNDDGTGRLWSHLTTASETTTDYDAAVVDSGIVRVWRQSGGDLTVDIRTQQMTTWTVLAGSVLTTDTAEEGHLALAVQESGQMVIYFRDGAYPTNAAYVVSGDGGYSWGTNAAYDDGLAQWWMLDEPQDATLGEGIVIEGAAVTSGRVLVIGGLSAGAASSVVGISLGGWSSLTYELSGVETLGFETYYPMRQPGTKSAQYSTTLTGAMAETAAYTNGAGCRLYHRLSGASGTGYTTFADVAVPLHSRSALWVVDAQTSSTTALGQVWLELTVDNAGGTYQTLRVDVDFASRSIRARNYTTNVATVTWPTGADVIEILADLDADEAAGAVYYRVRGDAAWVEVASSISMVSSGLTGRYISWGRQSGSGGSVTLDTLLFVPGLGLGLHAGMPLENGVPALTGAVSGPREMRTPEDVWVSWTGSPLVAGNRWRVRAISDRPVSVVSPWSTRASTGVQWVGEVGTAGAEYLVAVYDLQRSFDEPLPGLTYVSWANAPYFDRIQLVGWDGAAWQTLIEAGTTLPGWGSTVGFTYADCRLRPYQYTGASRHYERDELRGLWAYWADGTHALAGLIAGNSAGRWSTASGVPQLDIRIVPSSLTVITGVDEAFASASHVIRVYTPTGVAVQDVSATDVYRYVGIRARLAPGAVQPAAGLLSFGEAMPLSRWERDGMSEQVTGKDAVSAVAGRVSAQRARSAVKRTVELPYEQVLKSAGGDWVSAEVPNYHGQDGTAYARVDGNVATVRSLYDTIGQRALIGLAWAVEWESEPTTQPSMAYGADVLWGRLGSGYAVTASRGSLRDRVTSSYVGTSITVTEE